MANYGLSINEDYIAIKSYADNKIYSYPFYICKLKDEDKFLIGEEAYKLGLGGEALGVDKLFTLALKNSSATLYDKSYNAYELLTSFFKMILEQFNDIDFLCVASYKNTTDVLIFLQNLFENLKPYVKNFKITTFEEALSYYSIIQKEQDHFAFIELDEKTLSFYDASFHKSTKQAGLLVRKMPNTEVFSLDILNEDAGRKIADKILLNFAKNNIEGHNFSHIFLIGKGFDIKDQFKSFMNYICVRNKVRDELYAFVIGASLKAHDISTGERMIKKYKVINDSRLKTYMHFKAKENGEETYKCIAYAGDEWFGKKVRFDVIPDDCNSIEILFKCIYPATTKSICYPLHVDPMRPKKATKLKLKFTFSEANKVDFEVRDMGFGEFYKPKDKSYVYEIITSWD